MRGTITAIIVFCALFSVALAVADIRVGCFMMAVFAAVGAGIREELE